MMQAVIFDLDGVIISTDEYHYRAWKHLADGIGVPFDEAVNHRLRGVSRMASLDIILEKYPTTVGVAQKSALAEQKNDTYRKLLDQLSPTDLPDEVKRTLDALRNKGYLLAIGSSSKNASFILKQIGLEGYFDAVSDGNNITRSKPHPEVFLMAAGYLGVEPAHCYVVEDAVPGVLAAHAAGMKSIAIGNAAENKAGQYNILNFTQISDIVFYHERC